MRSPNRKEKEVDIAQTAVTAVVSAAAVVVTAVVVKKIDEDRLKAQPTDSPEVAHTLGYTRGWYEGREALLHETMQSMQSPTFTG